MKNFALIPAVAIALIASAASADTIVGSAGASWQAFPTTLNTTNANRPYWDQNSLDGTNMNVGDYLKGPFPAVTSPTSTPNWWGTTGTTATNFDANFHFNSNGGPIAGQLELEVSGWSTQNIIGWYDESDPSVKHVLWNGAATPTSNASALFSPTSAYGLYITSPAGTWYSDSSLNAGADAGEQHFSVFAIDLTPGNEKYEIGAEDMAAYGSSVEQIGDYNDEVFTLQAVAGGSPVPEPASLSALAMGAGVMFLRRRNKKS